MGISIFDTNTNDSGAPSILSLGYSPSDLNDSIDLNCWIDFSDDTLVDHVDLNVSGPNLSILYSKSVLSSSGFVDYNIAASLLNGGDVNCAWTVYDVAGNTASDFNLVDVNDSVGPVIYGVVNSPDGNSDIDAGEFITVDANVSEFTDLNFVTLYYRDWNSSGGDWNSLWDSKLMDLNLVISDWNEGYDSNFVAVSGAYQYYVYAVDVNDNNVSSSVVTIYANDDLTWELKPISQSFGNKSGVLSTVINVGDLNVTNTGDANIDFSVGSNWGNKYEIYYKGVEDASSISEGLSGGKTFELAPGYSEIVTVTLKTKATERSDALTVTVDALDSGSLPDSNIPSTHKDITPAI